MNRELIRKKANHLAKLYKSRDPSEIIRGMNVILVYYPLEDIRGFYQYFQRNNLIYIDERLSDQEKKFVLAHELGHMLLHKKANAIFMDTRTHFNGNRFEMDANLFAMELLVSDDVLAENSSCTIEQLSRILGYHENFTEHGHIYIH